MPLLKADWLLSEKINNPLLLSSFSLEFEHFALNGQAIYCMKSAVIVEPQWRQLSPNHQRVLRKVRFHSPPLEAGSLTGPAEKSFIQQAKSLHVNQSDVAACVDTYIHTLHELCAPFIYIEANIWQRARVTNWCCTRAPSLRSKLPGAAELRVCVVNCEVFLNVETNFALHPPVVKLPNLPRRYLDKYIYMKSWKGWAPWLNDC